MKKILKRSLAMLLSLVMVMSLLLTGVPMPAAYAADAPTPISVTLLLDKKTDADEANGIAAEYLYKLSCEGSSAPVTVTAKPETMTVDVSKTPVEISGAEALTELVATVDGLSFTFKEADIPAAAGSDKKLAATVALDKNDLGELLVGKSVKLTASASVSGGTLEWESSDPAVTVENGIVTAVAESSAPVTITASLKTAGGVLAATATATVTPKNAYVNDDYETDTNIENNKVFSNKENADSVPYVQYNFTGLGLTEEICAPLVTDAPDHESVKKEFKVNDETTEAFHRYTFDQDGEYTLWGNSFTVDKNDPEADAFRVLNENGQGITATVENVSEDVDVTLKTALGDQIASIAQGGSHEFEIDKFATGDVVLTLKDKSGNTATYSETIIPMLEAVPEIPDTIREIDGTVYLNEEFQVTVDGVPDEAEVEVDGKPRTLDANGQFTVHDGETLATTDLRITKGNSTYVFHGSEFLPITVDKTPPTVTVTAGMDVTVYSNGNTLYINPSAVTTDPNGNVTGGGDAIELTLTGTVSEPYMQGDALVSNENAIEHTYTCAANTITQIDLSDFDVKDAAGNPAIIDLNSFITGDFDAVYVDRRPPSAESPKYSVEISAAADSSVVVDGSTVYTGDVTFTVTANAEDSEVGDSGLAGVYYMLKGSNGVFGIEDDKEYSYTAPVTLTANGKESGNVTFYAYAMDNVHNKTVAATAFAVDNKAPKIEYSLTGAKKDGAEHYSGDVTVTVTVDELNFDPKGVTGFTPDADKGWTGVDGKNQAGFTVRGDAVYNYTVNATDKVGLPAEEVVISFVIDTTPPVINVKYGDETASDEKEYIQDNREATITVEEANFVADDVVVTVDGAEYAGIWTGNELKISFEDEAEHSLKVTYTDRAGNAAKEFSDEFVIDKTAPVVKIDAPGTAGSTSYFNAEQTVTVTVTEKNFSEKGCVLEVNGEEVAQGDETMSWSGWVKSENETEPDTWINTLTLSDGAYVTSVKADITDLAGREVSASSDNAIIVDSTAPTVEMTVVDEDKAVDSFAFNDELGLAYIKLKNPVDKENGWEYIKPEEGETIPEGEPVPVKITITVTVSDWNMKLGNDDNNVWGEWLKDGTAISFDFEEEPKVNADSSVSFSKNFTIDPDQSGEFYFKLHVKDLAGNAAAGIKTASVNGTMLDIVADENGDMEKHIVIDRRRPTTGNDSSAPVISFAENPGALANKAANGVDLYDGSTTFSAKVTDDYALSQITWEVTGGPEGFVTGNGTIEGFGDPDNAETKDFTSYDLEIPITVNGNDECNDLTLSVTAYDESGNGISYKKAFAVDTLAPRVSVEYDNNDVQNGTYFKEARTATVTVEDINFNAASFNINGETVEGEEGSKVFQYTFDPDDGKTAEYSFSIAEVSDLAGNKVKEDTQVDYGNSAAHEAFTVDRELPVMQVSLTPAVEGNTLTLNKDKNNTLYLNCDAVLQLTLKDSYLDDVAAGSVSYTLNNVQYTVELSKDNGYTASIELKAEGEGDSLTDLSFTAYDKAGNPLSEVLVNSPDVKPSFNGKDGSFSLTEKLKVDDRAPYVEIVMPSAKDAANVVGKDAAALHYFAEGQTVTVTVADYNLNGDPQITCTGENLGTEFTWEPAENKIDGMPTYTCALNLDDSMRLDDVTVSALDYSGHTTEVSSSGGAAEKTETSLSGTEYKVSSVSGVTQPIIIDCTAPAVTLGLSSVSGEDIESYYTNGDTVYVVLKDKNILESGKPSTLADQKINLTVEVEDKNITYIEADGGTSKYFCKKTADATEGMKDNGKWGETDKENTIAYTDFVEVKADEAGKIVLKIKVVDLAGNVPEKLTVKTEAPEEKEVKTTFEVAVKEDGTIEKVFSVDRQRPTSGAEATKPPVLDLRLPAGVTSVGTAPNSQGQEVELFNKAFAYLLSINDGIDTSGNAGLASVEWTVEDGKNLISGGDSKTFEDGEYSAEDIKIPLSIEENGESNDAVLTVTVTDKVGNQVMLTKNIAIDTKTPEISVTFNNNDAENTKYYKAERIATIAVTDINFVPGQARLYTEAEAQPVGGGWTYTSDPVGKFYYVSETAWTKDGDTWKAEVVYGDSNGQDRNLYIDCTDRAGNKTRTDSVPSFVVDLKDPVIEVRFDNNDSRNGKYYNASRTATVTITETNFGKAEGVEYKGTASLDGNGITLPQLSGWTGNGDVHVSSVQFKDDGDYSFTIDYTDLSGRTVKAKFDSGNFTVDQTIPKVEISNIENYSANRGSVAPIVSFEDINFDGNGYTVEVTKVFNLTTRQEVNLDRTVAAIRNGVVINFADLANVLENDGIYTITARITDLAGNVNSATVTYSVNRKGSTYYAYDDPTKQLLSNVYSNQAPTLKIAEVNPDDLMEYGVTVSVNNSSRTLSEGTDYTVEHTGGAGSFKQYIYTISSSVFQSGGSLSEGAYTIVFDSKDAAGNLNSNRDNEMNAPVNFTLDETPPIISRTGIENNDRIRAESRAVTIIFQDGSAVSKVEIYLNGELIKTLEGEELRDAGDSYTFNIEQSNHDQQLEVRVYDAAGNEAVMEPVHFYINSSGLRQFVHNTPLFIGCIVALLAIIGGVFYIVLAKKKSSKEEETTTV